MIRLLLLSLIAFVVVTASPANAETITIETAPAGAEVLIWKSYPDREVLGECTTPCQLELDHEQDSLWGYFVLLQKPGFVAHELKTEDGVVEQGVRIFRYELLSLSDASAVDRADKSEAERPATSSKPAEAVEAPLSEGELARLCDQGFGRACFRLGQSQVGGSEAERDFEVARQSYRSACDLDYLEGCTRFGDLVLAGKGGAADPDLALSTYDDACDQRSGSSCFAAGRARLRGQGIPQNVTLARSDFSEACELGETQGCLYFAYMLRSGRGGSVDLVRARGIAEAACYADNRAACGLLGDMQLNGMGGEVAVEEGVRNLGEDCGYNGALSCFVLGEHYYGQSDLDRSSMFLDRACIAGHPEACIKADLVAKELEDRRDAAE